MILDTAGPSQIEIKSLGIGLGYTSNVENLDLDDNEFLVVGEQYTPEGGDSTDTIYNLIVNKDIVGVHTSRKRINPTLDEDVVKSSGLYVGSDLICDGSIIANSFQIKNITIGQNFDNQYVSNLTVEIKKAVNEITNNSLFSAGYLINNDINNIYTTSFLSLGNIGDTYGNTNTLNIAATANYNVRNAQISIKNKINVDDQTEAANFRIGIIGDTADSPAVFSTTEGMPLTFHIGMKSDDLNQLYSTQDGRVLHTSTNTQSLTIDTRGNVAIGSSESRVIERDDLTFSNYTKLRVSGSAEIDNIYTYDYITEETKHIDDIYIRKTGKTFDASQIIPGDFDSAGPFKFNSDLYIGNDDDSLKLEVNNLLNVKGDIIVENNTIVNDINVNNNAFFNKTVQIDENVNVENDVIVGRDLLITRGGIKIDDIRLNIQSLNPVMIDSSIADASNINGSNILIFATSEVISFTSGSNMVIPGKLGVGVSENDTFNDQLNIIKDNSEIYEISIKDFSLKDEVFVNPEVLIGHHNFTDVDGVIVDKSLIINTNAIDELHNIYFYTGIDRNEIKDVTPNLTIHQNGNIGVNTKDPLKHLHVNGDILCQDLYVTKNNTPQKALFFVSKKPDFVNIGNESQAFFYLSDEEGVDKYTINVTEKGDNTFKGLNVSGGIHAIDGGFYEENLKLATLKIIDEQNNYSYINSSISIGIQNPSQPDINAFQSPLNVRNLSKKQYNDSIIRIYRGNRQGGALNSAIYSGIDICEYDLYRVDIFDFVNLNKWFIYKSHSQQKDTIDTDVMVGPLQIGYTDGTQHPEHYGLTMYYDKNKAPDQYKSSYHIDINNPNIYDYTNKDFPKSAMSIYGNLDVHGNINIINPPGATSSFNYLIDGQGINISQSAIDDIINEPAPVGDQSSTNQHDVVIKGKKVAVLTEDTFFVGHRPLYNADGIGETGFQTFIKNYQKDIPLFVYQNTDKTDIVGKFVSNSINTKFATVEIATNDLNAVNKTISSVKLEVTNNTETQKSVFKIRPYINNTGTIDNFNDAISIYNYNIEHNHIFLGTRKFSTNEESQNIALHVDNPVKYGLQVTSENNPSINLHHHDGVNNDFWIIKGSYGENYDKFVIQNSYSTGSYLPDENNVKNVVVLSRERFGLHVDDPEYTLHAKGIYNESTMNLTNRYDDTMLNQRSTIVSIENTKLEYTDAESTIYTDQNMYQYNDNSYHSGIKYVVDADNVPNVDIYGNLIYNDVVRNSNFIVQKEISNSNVIEIPLDVDDITYTTSDLVINQPYFNIDLQSSVFTTSNTFSYTPIVSNTGIDVQFHNTVVNKVHEFTQDGNTYHYNYDIITVDDTDLTSSIEMFIVLNKSIVNVNSNIIIQEVSVHTDTSPDNYQLNVVHDVLVADNISNFVTTSNVFHYKTKEFTIDVDNITKRFNYFTGISGPPTIITDDLNITQSSVLNKIDVTSNVINIDSFIDGFLKIIPDGLEIRDSFVNDFTNIEFKNLTFYQEIDIFDQVIKLDISISDKYHVYNFVDNIDNIYLHVNTLDFVPHMILQNNVDLLGQENQFGRINEIYSKDGSVVFKSATQDRLIENTILNIDKDGDVTVGNDLITCNIIVNGAIRDRLGNVLVGAYSNYEEFYNQSLYFGAESWNLQTSNFSVNSLQYIDFTLSGSGPDASTGVKIEKILPTVIEYEQYDLLTVIDNGSNVFKIRDGGFTGLGVEPSLDYDLSIKEKLYCPNINSISIKSSQDIESTTISANYFQGDTSRVSNVNLADKTTDQLPEGTSNKYIVDDVYFTINDKFEVVGDVSISGIYSGDASLVSNVNLADKTTDQLPEGTSNKYIVNDVYSTINDLLEVVGDVSISGIYSGDASLVSNVNLADKTTDQLPEGTSNKYIVDDVYFTINDKFEVVGDVSISGIYSGDASLVSNVNLADKTTDQLSEGTSNKYIVNDVYSTINDLFEVVGDVSISGIYSGDASLVSNVNLADKTTDQLSEGTSNKYIVNDVYSTINDLFEVVGDVSISGIYSGDASLVSNVNLADKTTDQLPEGIINKYIVNEEYTVDQDKVLIIRGDVDLLGEHANIGNELTCNIIMTSSNIHFLGNVEFQGNVVNVSPVLTSSVKIETKTDFQESFEIVRENISADFVNIHVTEHSGDNIIFNISSNKNVGIGTKPLDNDYVLQVNGDMSVSNLVSSGTITATELKASNLIITGETTTINTNKYETENLEILTTDIDNPAFSVTKSYLSSTTLDPDSIFVSIKTKSDTDVVKNVMTIKTGGDVDFHNATVESSQFSGCGSNLTYLFTNYDTDDLLEGNLNKYYTQERSTNISNYVLNSSNELAENASNLSQYVYNPENFIPSYSDISSKPTFESTKLIVGATDTENNNFGAVSADGIIYNNTTSNLGIGVVPDALYKLDVAGDIHSSGDLRLDIDSNIYIGASLLNYNHLDLKPTFESTKLIVGAADTENNNFGAVSADGIIYDNTTSNLGIGVVPDALYKLDVAGDIHSSGDLRLDIDSNIYIGTSLLNYNHLDLKPTFESTKLIVGAADTENNHFGAVSADGIIYNNTTSNLGIGVDPDALYKLDVAGDIHSSGDLRLDIDSNIYIGTSLLNYNHLDLKPTFESTKLIVGAADTENNHFGAVSADGIIYDNTTSNLGIGVVPDALYKLDVAGDIHSSGDLRLDIDSNIYIGTSLLNYNHLDLKPTFESTKLIVGAADTENNNFGAVSAEGIIYNNTTSNLGIGVVPNALYKLDVAGIIHSTGNITTSGSLVCSGISCTNITATGDITSTGDITAGFSDVRLKDVLGNIDNPLEKIMEIDCFRYVANDLAHSYNISNNNVQIGVSAQDVQNVFPEVVSIAPFDRLVNDNGQTISNSSSNYLTVCYERLVPVLIECIKELKMQIDTIKDFVHK
jgi:hypothetical protein